MSERRGDRYRQSYPHPDDRGVREGEGGRTGSGIRMHAKRPGNKHTHTKKTMITTRKYFGLLVVASSQ